MTHDINIHHEDDHESASSYLVEEIRNLLVNSNRNFSIGLSGGNTPKLTYSIHLSSIVQRKVFERSSNFSAIIDIT